ncbi:MAG: protein translocase subunit SecD [Verrucomicrobiota bacterium]
MAFFTFFLGLAILALFIWYFATDVVVRKRTVGTLLAVLLTGLCLYAINPPSEKIPLGIDLRGGVAFILEIQEKNNLPVSKDAQDQTIKVLTNRLNAFGTQDMLIAPFGSANDRIMVQMPGVSQEEVDKVRIILEQTAELHFSVLHPESGQLVPLVDAGQHIEPGFVVKEIDRGEDEPNERVLVSITPEMAGSLVTRAGARYGDEGWEVNLSFTSDGESQFYNLTRELAEAYNPNSGLPPRRLAIVMDDEVISAPTVTTAIAGGCRISGGSMTAEDARSLASALENPLDQPLEILNSFEVSPSMGKATIQQGLYAGLAGLAVTLLFVILYYKFAGFVALFGLAVNIALLFGAVAIFQFTLTLPGIAGIILTIGIAIDANVLIYERLREELRSGKSLTSAIDSAYSKAFSAIFDANITTLLAAFALFQFASGSVRGFAVTLMIGIIASLFSSLVVTRVCFGWATASGLLKNIKLWSFLRPEGINFLGKRRIAMMASLIVVAGALVIIGIKQEQALSVDFTGGDLVILKVDDPIPTQTLDDALKNVDLPGEYSIQTMSAAGQGEFIQIRAPFETGGIILDELRKDLNQPFPDAETDSIGPVIGGEMLKSSITALAIGILFIFAYVAIRFEISFAIGAIVALAHDIIITVGIIVLFDYEVSLILIGALLTIAGYSINDTIVVFDRIREGLKSKRGDVVDVMNLCLNETLGRTLLTSITTLIVVISLFFFGGPALRSFAFTIIVGVLAGTYSSIFIAAPIVLWWAKTRKLNLRREVLDAEQATVKPIGGQG